MIRSSNIKPIKYEKSNVCYSNLYEPGCITAIMLPLRRTLVRSYLYSTKEEQEILSEFQILLSQKILLKSRRCSFFRCLFISISQSNDLWFSISTGKKR